MTDSEPTPISVTVRAIAIAVVLVLASGFGPAASSQADIYMRRDADGNLSYTDVPLTTDYKLIIRESPEILPWREYAHREARRNDLDPKLVAARVAQFRERNAQLK